MRSVNLSNRMMREGDVRCFFFCTYRTCIDKSAMTHRHVLQEEAKWNNKLGLARIVGYVIVWTHALNRIKLMGRVIRNLEREYTPTTENKNTI